MVAGMVRGLGERKERQDRSEMRQMDGRDWREDQETWCRRERHKNVREDPHTGMDRAGIRVRKNFLFALTFEMSFAGNLLFLRITCLPARDALTVDMTLSHLHATMSLLPSQTLQL